MKAERQNGMNVEDKLFDACSKGDIVQVEYLLTLPLINVNQKDGYGRTPIIMAASNGYHEIVTLLIAAGADVVMKNAFNPLHSSVYSGDTETIEVVLEALADAGVEDAINIRDPSGHTALFEAARCGIVDAIETLFEYGANVELANYQGMTPLMIAVEERQVEAVNALISAGADTNRGCNDYSGTPLMMAAQTTYTEMLMTRERITDDVRKDYQICLALLLGGADPNIVNIHGKTPLLSCVSDFRYDIIKLLIRRGAQIDHVDVCGENVLHRAIKAKQLEAVKLLLNYPVNVKAIDKLGKTPLHLAASLGLSEIIPLLINKGADINAVDDEGSTPLMVALLVGNVGIPTLYQLGWVQAADSCNQAYNYCVNSWNNWYYS